MWGLLWDYFNALCLYYVGGGSTEKSFKNYTSGLTSNAESS